MPIKPFGFPFEKCLFSHLSASHVVEAEKSSDDYYEYRD